MSNSSGVRRQRLAMAIVQMNKIAAVEMFCQE